MRILLISILGSCLLACRGTTECGNCRADQAASCTPGDPSCGSCATPNKICQFSDAEIVAELTCTNGIWKISIIETENPICFDGGT
jgi:hypothetical protein